MTKKANNLLLVFLLVGCLLALPSACQRAQEGEPEQAHSAPPQWPKFHEGRGKVLAVIPERHRLVIDHEAIPTIPMEAMTMNYQVYPPDLLNGIQQGDYVRFKLQETEQHLFVVGMQKTVPQETTSDPQPP